MVDIDMYVLLTELCIIVQFLNGSFRAEENFFHFFGSFY